jgi:hypothetical protein
MGRGDSRLRKAPSHHHQLALAIGRGAHHWRHLIREDSGQRRYVAGNVAHSAHEVADRLLRAGDAVKVAHVVAGLACLSHKRIGAGF